MAHDLKIVTDQGSANFGDLYLNGNGDIDFVVDATDQESAVRQRVLIGGSLHRGEWPLDVDQGIPYREVMVKNPDIGKFLAQFKTYMENRLNVFSVENLEYDYDPGSRELGFDVTIKTLEGLEINVEG